MANRLAYRLSSIPHTLLSTKVVRNAAALMASMGNAARSGRCPFLYATTQIDPAGAILFLETFGPGQDGPLYIGTSHDGWKSRRDQAREQIDIIAAQNAGTSIDWQPHFVEELAAARAAMETSASR